MTERSVTERIYIDPERLFRLKKHRTAFQLVPSAFEPPPDPEQFSPFQRHRDHIHRHPKKELPTPREQIKTNNPNVEFLLSLLQETHKRDLQHFEEGKFIDLGDDRCLIVEGQVRVEAKNGNSFLAQEGLVLFAAEETRQKVSRVISTRLTTILRIRAETYTQYVRKYLFLKNAQKIKFMKCCPFLEWGDGLLQELANFMKCVQFDRDTVVYTSGKKNEELYFVKEGIILLQRTEAVNNILIQEYEQHYEKSVFSESEVTIIVKKGMIFGLDGVLMKDVEAIPHDSPELLNQPDFQSYELKVKKDTRVYTARTIGTAEIYVLNKSILDTLISGQDLTVRASKKRKEVSEKQMERICGEYTDLVMKHGSPARINRAVAKKNIVLATLRASSLTRDIKIQHVQSQRLQEKRIRQKCIASIIPNRRSLANLKGVQQVSRTQELISRQLIRMKGGFRDSTTAAKDSLQHSRFAFPILAKKSTQIKKGQAERGERKIERKAEKKPGKKAEEGAKLLNVRSYRSIISSLS